MGSVYNPRHPHHCVVYRMAGETEFSPGERVVLYDGACRKYTTRSSRTSTAMMTSQYTLSIPEVVKALAGDRVEVDDYIGHFEGVVTEVTCNNIGTQDKGHWGGTDIYWNSWKH